MAFFNENFEKLIADSGELRKDLQDACWKGYKLQGTKKKGGKTVDNCVKM